MNADLYHGTSIDRMGRHSKREVVMLVKRFVTEFMFLTIFFVGYLQIVQLG